MHIEILLGVDRHRVPVGEIVQGARQLLDRRHVRVQDQDRDQRLAFLQGGLDFHPDRIARLAEAVAP